MESVDLEQRQFELQYRADYSQRYHRRRATFLKRIDLMLSSVVIFSSGAAFADLVSGAASWVLQSGAVTIALITTLQVLFAIGANGTKHAEWMKRWNKLSAEIENTHKPTAQLLKKWNGEKAELESDCVSELRALALDCEDRSASFFGIPGRQHKIWWPQRLLLHFGTFQNNFPLIAEPRNSIIGQPPLLEKEGDGKAPDE